MELPKSDSQGGLNQQRLNTNLVQELARLRKVEDQFRLFVESITDYAFILMDENNCITGWNTGAERLTGYTEAEALAQSASIIFTPEDRQKGEDERELMVAVREGRAEDERWHMRKDGTQFWGSGVMTALRNGEGKVIGFAKVMRDLTARRIAEQALRESEERFRLFVENVRAYALFQVDPEGRISGWNAGAERFFGYRAEEIVGQPVARLFSPEDAEQGEPEKELTRSLAQGHVEDERWMVRKDGSRFFARWVTNPVYDENRQLRGFAKVLEDATERRQIEEQRERLQQRERELMNEQVRSTVEALDRTKDELRALAASLLTAQEDERRRISRDLHDDIAQRLGMLQLQVEQLRRTLPPEIAGLVDASLATFQTTVATVGTDVRHMSHRLHPSILEDLGIEEALRSLISIQRTNGMPIEFITSGFPRSVLLPVATALYRVTQEALHNVVKHAAGAPATVTLSYTESGVRLSIRDEGPGFDREAVRKKKGLGLVSMQERVKLIEGEVVIDSAPGQGTELHINIPNCFVDRL